MVETSKSTTSINKCKRGREHADRGTGKKRGEIGTLKIKYLT